MTLVSELIKQRPNLKTIILKAEILKYPSSYIANWLFELNALELKFFHADGPEDIHAAFQKLDVDSDGAISIQELSRVCDERVSNFWSWKYGADYKVIIFMYTKNYLRWINFILR